MVPVHDYEKRYAEALAITKMRGRLNTSHLLLLGAEGEGAYSWYLTVVMKKVQVASLLSTSVHAVGGYAKDEY